MLNECNHPRITKYQVIKHIESVKKKFVPLGVKRADPKYFGILREIFLLLTVTMKVPREKSPFKQ